MVYQIYRIGISDAITVIFLNNSEICSEICLLQKCIYMSLQHVKGLQDYTVPTRPLGFELRGHPEMAPSDYVPPLSPLYELSPQATEHQPIRHADYGDREDVLADHEDLRADYAQAKPFRYPPSAQPSKPSASSWTRRRRRFSPMSVPVPSSWRPC